MLAPPVIGSTGNLKTFTSKAFSRYNKSSGRHDVLVVGLKPFPRAAFGGYHQFVFAKKYCVAMKNRLNLSHSITKQKQL
jgi:hypothetical protein